MSQQSDHYNRSGLIAFLVSITISFLVMGYVVFLSPDIVINHLKQEKMDQSPQDSHSGKQAEPQFDPKSVSKPWETTPEMISYGHKVFELNCVACHGKEGKGDGPAAAGIVPPPRNLVEGKWKNGGLSQNLFSTISTGITGTSMASFSHLPKSDRWALVHFIRSITKNKPADKADELEKFASKAQ